MTSRPITIQTRNPELYLKLSGLNFHNEVILSNTVPKIAITKIVNSIGAEKVDVTPLIDGKVIISKKFDFKLNTIWKQ